MSVLDWLQRQLGYDDQSSATIAPQLGGYTKPVSPDPSRVADAYAGARTTALDHLQNVLGDMPGRFGGTSYDPNRSLEQNALDPAALQQATTVATQVGPAAIRAYHGSPHSFDRFDMSKIGTGEGAQMYSHGLYFGGAEPVAETYIGPNAGWKYGNAKAETIYDRVNNPKLERGLDSEGWGKLNAQRGFWEKVALGRAPRSIIDDARLNPDQFGAHELDYIKSLDPARFQRTGGNMYEVDLHTDPARLLDWDKTLSGQSPGVQEVLADRFGIRPHTGGDMEFHKYPAGMYAGPDPTGASIYQRLIQDTSPTGLARLNAPPLVSQQLREAGIPGAKYLDQGSRGAGEGTSNYVMYDDKLIEILRKYGIVPPVAAAGTGGLAGLGGVAPDT